MRKVLLVIGILVAVLLPATAASARGQTWLAPAVSQRGQTWLAPAQEGRGQTWASISDPGGPCSPWRVCGMGSILPRIICWHVDGPNSFCWIPWVW